MTMRCVAAAPDAVSQLTLALFLMYEACYNSEKSSWSPYWDVLPRRIEGAVLAA